jgi:hypothetical protein
MFEKQAEELKKYITINEAEDGTVTVIFNKKDINKIISLVIPVAMSGGVFLPGMMKGGDSNGKA